VSDDFVWQRSYVLRSVVSDTTRYVASRDNWGPLVVPPRMFFLLGDNRDNSLDSRYWGFLPSDHLIGEARRIYFSRDAAGRVRWDRLGRRALTSAARQYNLAEAAKRFGSVQRRITGCVEVRTGPLPVDHAS
jgi:hypothetical protein